jgi:hypothetical protein
VSALDPDRRLLLSRAKVAALVRSHWGVAAFDADPRPAMSGLVARQGERGWMLVDEDAGRALGRGLLWALRSGVRELHLLFSADDEAALAAARRGRMFRTEVAVWRAQGTELLPVVAEPLPPEPPLDGRARPYGELIRAAGAEPVVEWGTLFGDLWGLEVARVEGTRPAAGPGPPPLGGGRVGVPAGAAKPPVESDGFWLGVGVTKEDRLTHRLMWGDQPGVDAVRSVVEQVRAIREREDLAHPLNRVARERWLRAWLRRDPGQVGASALEPVSSSVPRADDVRVATPAAALGSGVDGEPVLVVCSVGFDSEAVPIALELAEAADAVASQPVRLRVAVPARDDHALLRLAKDDAVRPLELATVPDDWPSRCRSAAAVRPPE